MSAAEPTRLEHQLVSSLTLANVKGRLKGIAANIEDEASYASRTDSSKKTVLLGFAADVRECIELLNRFAREVRTIAEGRS